MRLDRRRLTAMMGNKIRYLLNDSFNDTLAAGSVNGTPATPGPGTRVVVDTAGTRLSVGSGVLNIASGAAANGDPGLRNSIAITPRTPGRIILLKFTPAGTGVQWPLQLDDDTGGVTFLHAFRFDTASLISIVVNNITGPAIGTFSAATAYTLAIILKSTGVYYFIKGGAYTYWTLLFQSMILTTATVYAGIANYNSAFTSDFLRVPLALYLPPVDTYDDFDRSNGAIGSTLAAGPDGQACSPRTYLGGATWQIATNKAVCTPTTLGSDLIVNGGFDADSDWTKGTDWTIGSGVATKVAGTAANLTQTVAPLTAGKWYTVTYTITRTAGTLNSLIGAFVGPNRAANGTYTDVMRADTTAFGFAADASFAGTVDNVSAQELTLTELIEPVACGTANIVASVALTITAGIKCGLVIRLDSESTTANFIIVGYDGSKVRMGKCVAGTYTNLINAAATYSAGANLVVVADGSSVSCFWNNALVGAVQTVSDAGILTNTKHGLLSTGAGAQLDTLQISPRGNEGQYSYLDKFTR